LQKEKRDRVETKNFTAGLAGTEFALPWILSPNPPNVWRAEEKRLASATQARIERAMPAEKWGCTMSSGCKPFATGSVRLVPGAISIFRFERERSKPEEAEKSWSMLKEEDK
jgi:hypothetical protein